MCTVKPFLPEIKLSTKLWEKQNYDQKEENLKGIREYMDTFFQGIIPVATKFSASCYIISILVHFLWLFIEPEPLQSNR